MVRVHLALGGVNDHFGILGAPLDVHFGVLGWPWASILGSWGSLGRAFWGSGDALGRVWRAVVAKDRLPKLAPHHFKRFWSPKGAQKAPKMDLKSLKSRLKNLLKFWSDFEAVSGAFLVNFGSVFGTLNPQK